MIEWAGWKMHEDAHVMVEPLRASVRGVCSPVLAVLIRARGKVVSMVDLCDAVRPLTAVEPRQAVTSAVNALRLASGKADFIVNIRGVGYHLKPLVVTVDEIAALEQMRKVVDILIEQFEAGPAHARIVAAAIAEVYA